MYDNLETLDDSAYDDVIAIFEAADLVMFSRDSNSGDYNDPIEHEVWTDAFTTPMIVMTPYLLRSSRWDMVASTAIQDAMNPMVPVDLEHPIFDGIELNEDGQIDFWSQLGPEDHIDLVNTTDFGFAEVIAVEAETEIPWIAYWDPEVENGDFYNGSATWAGGPRLYLSAGSDDDPNTWGEKNITPAGDQIVLNAITFLTGDPGVISLPNDCNNDGAVTKDDLNCILASGGPDALNSLLNELSLLPGDLDGNGEVGFPDFLVLSNNYNQAVYSYTQGDVDGDGTVGFPDFLLLSSNYGATANALSSVPEPTSITLCLVAAMTGLAMRRRRVAG